ncbi:MAG: leucyl aminopeptidase [Deltaproteobacteria bacterium]|jgi:leucyl aminopeptidase|nr:leucyl aminopeptidase [Deltaproteobacteria bacterium]
MDILFARNLGEAGLNCLLLPVFNDKKAFEYVPELARNLPWLQNSPALADFRAKKDETALLYGPPEALKDAPLPRLLLVGLGKRDDFKPQVLRDAVAAGMKACLALKLEKPGLSLEVLPALAGAGKTAPDQAQLAEEAVLGALLALHYREICQTPQAGDEARVEPASLTLVGPASATGKDRAAVAKAQAVAHGMKLTRDLVNGPANQVTPAYLETRAQELARAYGFSCTALGPDYLRDEGFGAFCAVARGSRTEPRLIILEHRPQNPPKNLKPIVVVGKGVTFDSGGLCIKPAANMDNMKTDMAGAGTVIGLFAAFGEAMRTDETLKDRHLVGIMPCAENMPGGNATRPGDVVITLAGKTVEIINTDAEGRLLLCDALTLAQQRWDSAALIDLATLTGACVVALGEKTAGLFNNNDELRDRLMALGEKCGERFWPMPIYDEDLIKGKTADLANAGGRSGGAVFAAAFLKQFINEKTAWAHLDIAGPARLDEKTAICPGGATAVCLRTLFELVKQGL